MSVQNSHQISDIKVLLKIGANGNGIVSVEKTGTVGNVDTYTITFSDGTTTNFDLTNGTSIDTIEKTDTQGLVDTYTITLTDGSTTTFEVVNGGVEFGTLETETGNPLSFETDSAQVANNTTVNYAVTQSGTGDPSPSNIRPFIGMDALQLAVPRKNLWNRKILIPSKYLLSDGTMTTSANYGVSDYIPIGGVESLTVSKQSAGDIGGYPSICLYDANFNYVTGADYNNETSCTITVPSTAKWARFSINVNTMDYMLEAGDEATDYEPYNPATDINIALDSILYGGTWDVEKGLLTITHARVDMGSLAWTRGSTNRFDYTFADKKNGVTNVWCEIYKTTEDSPIGDLSIKGATDSGKIFIKDTNYDNATTFTTAVTGHYIVYELATPIVIHLTPHAVELLEGANIVTSNGTSIDLVYKTGVGATLADLKPLADCINAVEEAQTDKSDITDLYLTGTTNTTGATILAGTYFYLDGLFCKALLDIASNATLTKGTNYKVTTIGAELTALANS